MLFVLFSSVFICERSGCGMSRRYYRSPFKPSSLTWSCEFESNDESPLNIGYSCLPDSCYLSLTSPCWVDVTSRDAQLSRVYLALCMSCRWRKNTSDAETRKVSNKKRFIRQIQCLVESNSYLNLQWTLKTILLCSTIYIIENQYENNCLNQNFIYHMQAKVPIWSFKKNKGTNLNTEPILSCANAAVTWKKKIIQCIRKSHFEVLLMFRAKKKSQLKKSSKKKATT